MIWSPKLGIPFCWWPDYPSISPQAKREGTASEAIWPVVASRPRVLFEQMCLES